MDNFRRRHVLPLVAIILLGVMVILDWIAIMPFNIEGFAIFALVVLTFMYTTSVDRQTELLRQQSNAAAPVMEIDAHGSGRIAVHFRNIGSGPALNFRCWVEDDQFPSLRNMQTSISRRAVGVDKDFTLAYITTDILDYTLGQGYLRAQYEDVFGQTYESCLMISENALPELKCGRAKEKIII